MSEAVAVSTVEELCRSVSREFPRSVVFLGRLIFEEEKWYHRLLHNETAIAIQRRLQFEGVQTMVLPIRVLDSAPAARVEAPLGSEAPRAAG